MRIGEQRARRALIEEYLADHKRDLFLCPLGPKGCLISRSVCLARQHFGDKKCPAEGGNYTRHPTMKPHPNYLWCQRRQCELGRLVRAKQSARLPRAAFMELQRTIKKWNETRLLEAAKDAERKRKETK